MRKIFSIRFIIYLFVLLLIGLCILILYKQKNKYENFENSDNYQNFNIGNILSEYFYEMGIAFLNNKDYDANFTMNKYHKGKQYTYDFIKEFPIFVECRKDINENMLKAGLTPENVNESFNKISEEYHKYIGSSAWLTIDKTHETFWLCMKPVVNEYYKKIFDKMGISKKIDCPIIHYRCSDVPFVKHSHYGFQKYSFFKDSLDQIQQKLGKKYGDVVIFYCNSHYSSNQNKDACNIYDDSLTNYIKDLGYNVKNQCGNAIDDFAAMFFAPAVISTCSSFSFMSGFFSDGIFISEGHYEDSNSYCNNCGDWLKHGYTISHSDVNDYNNTETVIPLLRAI